MAIPGSYRRALGQLNVGVPAPQSAYLKDLLAAAVGGPTGFNTDGNLQAGLNTEGNPLYGGLLDRTFSSPVTRARDPFHWRTACPTLRHPPHAATPLTTPDRETLPPPAAQHHSEPPRAPGSEGQQTDPQGISWLLLGN